MADTIRQILEVQDRFSQVTQRYAQQMGAVTNANASTTSSTNTLSRSQTTATVTATGLGIAFGALAIAGIGVSAAILKAADDVAEMADNLAESAEKVGVSIEFYQELAGIGNKVGTDIGVMTGAMRALTMTATEAAKKGGEAGEAYKTLGVNVKDSAGNMKGQEELFREVTLALSDMPQGFERAALAQKVFGRASGELNTVLNLGSKELEKQLSATSTAVTVSRELAQVSSDLKDSQVEMNAVWGKARNEALLPVISAMGDVTNAFLDFSKSEGVQKAIAKVTEFANLIGEASKGFRIEAYEKKLAEHAKTQAYYNTLLTEEAEWQARVESQKAKKQVNLQGEAEGLSSLNEKTKQRIALEKQLADQKSKLDAENEALYGGGISQKKSNGGGGGGGGSSTAKTKAEMQKERDDALQKQKAFDDAWLQETNDFITKENEDRIAYNAKLEADDVANKEAALQRQRDYHDNMYRAIGEQKAKHAELEAVEEQKKLDGIEKIKNASVQAYQEIGNAVLSIATTRQGAREREYAQEEEAVNKSNMSEKAKEAQRSAIQKKRDEDAKKSAKLQASINMALYIGTHALTVADAIRTVIEVGRDTPGGVLTRGAAMLTMGGITAGLIAQSASVKDAFSQREFGGSTLGGTPYRVGENGKNELFRSSNGQLTFIPNESGEIIPNVGGMGGGKTVHIVQNFYGGSADTATMAYAGTAQALREADLNGSIDWNGLPNFQRAVRGY